MKIQSQKDNQKNIDNNPIKIALERNNPNQKVDNNESDEIKAAHINGKYSLIKTIITVLCGFLLVLFTHFIDNYLGIKYQPTPDITSTNTNFFATPQISTSPVSPSPSPILTSTQDKPINTNATSSLEIITTDDFIKNFGWPTQNVDGSTYKLIGGIYSFSLACPSNFKDDYCDTIINVPYPLPSKYQIEIEGKIKRNNNIIPVKIGFRYRVVNSSKYYYVNFYNSGQCKIGLNNYEDPTDFYDVVFSNELSIDEIYSFGILVDGTTFTPLFNNKYLSTAEDGSITKDGATQLVVSVTKGGQVEIEFDNFIIKEYK